MIMMITIRVCECDKYVNFLDENGGVLCCFLK